MKFLGVENPNGYLVSVWKHRDQGEVRIIVGNPSVTFPGTSEVYDLARAKDLRWERVKAKLITRAGCIVEDLEKDIFFLKKSKDLL